MHRCSHWPEGWHTWTKRQVHWQRALAKGKDIKVILVQMTWKIIKILRKTDRAVGSVKFFSKS